MMKKVAILDDELMARNRLRSVFSEREDIEIMISSADAYEVLNYVETNPLDVIFLDMNMPEMNGVEFLEQLQYVDNNIAVVVTSGYSDFNYAKACLKYNVKAYLLKHELNNQLLDECFAQLDFNEVNEKNVTDISLFDLVEKNVEMNEDEQRDLLEPFLETNAHFFSSLIVGLGTLNKNIWDKTSYKKQALDLLDDFLHNAVANRSMIMTDKNVENGVLICIISFTDSHSMKDFSDYCSKIAVKLKKTAERLLNNQIYVKRCGIYHHLNDAVSSLKEIDLFENEQFYNISMGNQGTSSMQRLKQISAEQRRTLNFLLDKIEFDVNYFFDSIFLDDVNQFFDRIEKNFLYKADAIDLIAQLEGRINCVVSSQFNSETELKKDYQFVEGLGNFSAIKSYFLSVYKSGMKEYTEYFYGQFDGATQHSLRYITQNFSEDISLRTCAERVGVNYSYLSRSLKKEIGVSFTKLVNSIRVDSAKIYLSNSKLTIEQVANNCGFTNYNYFFKIFREFVGCSPMEYSAKHKEQGSNKRFLSSTVRAR